MFSSPSKKARNSLTRSRREPLLILGRRKSVDTPTRRSFINYSVGWAAEGLETNMSAEEFVSSARKATTLSEVGVIPDRRPSQLAVRKGCCWLHPSNACQKCCCWFPPVASSRVVRLPNMPPSPSAISLVCSTRLAGGACTNEVRQMFQTFGNPPPTCPPCIVPTQFTRLLQTSYCRLHM